MITLRINLPMMTVLALLLAAGSAAAQTVKRVPEARAEIQMSFAPLVKKSAPAVVNIFTRKIVSQRQFSPLFDDPFFRRFFGDNFGPGRLGGGRQRKVQNSLGSGVIIRANGTIITNHHVIEGADEIRVVLTDRREFEAKVLGRDPKTDLAVLKIDAGRERLPFLRLQDSDDLEVGDLVLAIGNPFGVGQTVTSGIVSALARTQVGINDLNFFIQTDAAINPGNSGGALISMLGTLVGINSAIYSKNGGSVGIGFAIPSNMVRSVLAGLTAAGRVRRPWFGAAGQTVTPDIAASLNLKRPVGILINNVYPGGPAARAGFRVGDVVTHVGGREVNDPEALRFRIATRAVGEIVRLKYLRGGRPGRLKLTIAAPPEIPAAQTTELSGAHPFAGATIANLSPALADEIGADIMVRGVIIREVRRGSTAERFRFQPGDIVAEVNGTEIKSVAKLQLILSRPARRWRLAVLRGGRVLRLSIN
ncbi:MAG: DegQ family serine endoprotease [Rhodospirillales bacterium]